QPDRDHHQDGDAHEPAALADTDGLAFTRARSLGRRGGVGEIRDRGDAHRIASSARKRRMFQIMTGITPRNRITAMAAPRPLLFWTKNHLIMRSAMTSVWLVSALPMTKTMSNTLRALMIM